jgi:hypothetical protein
MRRPSTGLDGHKQEEDAGEDSQYDQENLQDEIVSVSSDQDVCEVSSQGADPPPRSSTRGKARRQHLNEEITSLPPRVRRAIQPNHIKFRTCNVLAPM